MAITRADKFTPLDRKNQVYSDFLINLNPHPITKDIVKYVDEQAVIRSIRALLLTNKGERLYQPSIGSDIKRMLFEPMGASTAGMISQTVFNTIDNFEPRAKILSVEAIPDYDNNKYTVNITILVLNRQDPVSFNIALERIR
jgi:phage baseplate assembly protein W